jgi:hypothetical protein
MAMGLVAVKIGSLRQKNRIITVSRGKRITPGMSII